MSQTLVSKSGAALATAAEYDKLEADLNVMETPGDIFRRVSYWISVRLNCSFILFYAVKKTGEGDRVQYYGEQVRSISTIGTVVEDRIRKNPDVKGVLVHDNGTVSLPVVYPNRVRGYLFVGNNVNGERYTVNQIKMLVPVVRIVNNSLIRQEMRKVSGQKNRLQYAFSRYVSPEVVNDIMDSSEVIHPGGKKHNLSIIFTDIADFTTLSESLVPTKLLLVLNMYLNEMSQVIINLGGTIDKYEGDAIMAFFGAPKPLPDHAVRCCLAAIRMQKMQSVLNDQLLREKLISAPIHTRFGINSGDVIVGNVGSMQRLDYTAIGNNVNIASRIETANKKYETSILISEATYRMVKNYFRCRFVDNAELKGLAVKVPVYELLEEIKDRLPDYMNFGRTEIFQNSVEEELDQTDDLDEVEEIEEA